MNNSDKCGSNIKRKNVILHEHYSFLQALHESLLTSGLKTFGCNDD